MVPMRSLNMRYLLLVLLTVVLLWHLITAQQLQTMESQRLMMGTVFHIKAALPSNRHAKERFLDLCSQAFDEIARIEGLLSEWRLDSAVSALNRAAGTEPLPVPEELLQLTGIALQVAHETHGAFDITVKPLADLWSIKTRTIPPPEDEILRAHSLVGYRRLLIDRQERTMLLQDLGMAVGFGGIGKGYAAHRAGVILRDAGLDDFIVNAGGDLYVSGKKGAGYWSSGVRHPDRADELVVRFEVKRDCGIATSGDYERYFEYQDRRYHHIIDPRTGYPAAADIRSATALTEDPSLADALATALFINGLDFAEEFVALRPEAAYIIIDAEGVIHRSANLERFVKVLEITSIS